MNNMSLSQLDNQANETMIGNRKKGALKKILKNPYKLSLGGWTPKSFTSKLKFRQKFNSIFKERTCKNKQNAPKSTKELDKWFPESTKSIASTAKKRRKFYKKVSSPNKNNMGEITQFNAKV